MKVRFWGTRGSIPVSITAPAIRDKLARALSGSVGQDLSTPERVHAYIDTLGFDVSGTFGGHSSCVQVETGGPEHVILDMGSGARPLGHEMMARTAGVPQTYHVFMSHLHWDHIMGFPFFTPVYIPGNRLVIHTGHAGAEFAFRRQQGAPSFPVEYERLGATIEYDLMQAGEVKEIAGMRVSLKAQRHVGDSYGWRFERGGKTLVYSTDSEHQLDDAAEREGFVDFFRDADLVIFDAMYSLADAISVKADWGHSSNIVAVELCQAARARRLALFHHEPVYSDSQIAQVEAETRRFEEITREGDPLDVFAAWDGLEVAL
jgi:phosphoribosyl 1,2-cyclic phosphodiesterase